jgi:Mce-associated membrane protein
MTKDEAASPEPEKDQTASAESEDQVAAVPDADERETDPAESHGENGRGDTKPGKRELSISVSSLAITVVIVVLVAAIGVLSWLYAGAQHKVDEQARQSESNVRAEKVALDYAVNAAAMNYEDLNAWKVKLVAGTSSELKGKLSKAASSMEQILIPLQWNSTSSPLAAKVVSKSGGAYVVDSFVSVLTKTAQAPDPLRSTATYSVTIDSNQNWQISDVGGIGAVVDQK